MPITYTIDTTNRLVLAMGEGVLTGVDLFTYQREVWSRAELVGFDEIVDMSGVDTITYESSKNVKALAALSAQMDSQTSQSRLAIVAPGPLAFGLGRMYQTYREMAPQSNKEVRVFKTLVEARAWLGK